LALFFDGSLDFAQESEAHERARALPSLCRLARAYDNVLYGVLTEEHHLVPDDVIAAAENRPTKQFRFC
jgi:hypothetical protein